MRSEILRTKQYAIKSLKEMALSGDSEEEIIEASKYFEKLIKERSEKAEKYYEESKFPMEKLKSYGKKLKKAG